MNADKKHASRGLGGARRATVMLLCSRNAYVLTRPPLVRQDAPLTSEGPRWTRAERA